MNVSRSIQERAYQNDRHAGDRLSDNLLPLGRVQAVYPLAMKPLDQVRRDRLADLVTEYGSAANLARRIHRDRRQVSHWLTGFRNLSHTTAREIEAACLKPSGWLDHEHGPSVNATGESGTSSQPVRTDRAKMSDAIRLLRELAELQGVPELVADPIAISIAYDFLVEFDTPLTESNVLDITKRLAARIRGEDAAKRSSAA